MAHHQRDDTTESNLLIQQAVTYNNRGDEFWEQDQYKKAMEILETDMPNSLDLGEAESV